MASTRWRKSLTVTKQLESEPFRFEFFQAVRLLERAAVLADEQTNQAIEPVALNTPPYRELVHFGAKSNLLFSPADITQITTKKIENLDDSKNASIQWQMEVAFMGLLGAQGVMPYHLTETVLRELRNKNSGLHDFLDMFNHRIISMFYQAWHKYQLPVNYERNKQRLSRQPDLFTDALQSLAGIGSSELHYRQPVNDEVIAGLAGHLSRNICSADSLSRSIKQVFDLSVHIQQFVGQWQDLPTDVQCQLPSLDHPKGINNALGQNTILGSRCYHAQSKFRVVVEPLPKERFMELAPGSSKLEALKSYIRLTSGIEMDFDIQLTLADATFPSAQLIDTHEYQPMLGWNTHLYHNQKNRKSTSITLTQDIPAPDDSLPLAI